MGGCPPHQYQRRIQFNQQGCILTACAHDLRQQNSHSILPVSKHLPYYMDQGARMTDQALMSYFKFTEADVQANRTGQMSEA
jgi:hypothetical protein